MKKNKKVSLPKKPFLVLSRRAITGWVCFIFFVCAWMFVIGVLVGRGTAPIKFDMAGIQKKLEASREDLKNKEQLRNQGKSGIVKDKTKLDFYEALRDNREDTQIGKKKLSPSISKKAEPPPEKKLPPAIDSKAEKKIIGKAEPPQTGSTKQSQKPPIASKSKTGPSVKTYTIQAASVKDGRGVQKQNFSPTHPEQVEKNGAQADVGRKIGTEIVMKITKDEVLYVADLARLDLDQASIEKFAGQIGDVLEYVEKLNEVDTEGLRPTSHAISLTNVFREDEQRQPLDREQALANAPEKEDGNFVVPKIIE
jgi:aspartyl-tRNA(Asn)/glutamyl-tRNA(Gln) amidotransferase subunit C